MYRSGLVPRISPTLGLIGGPLMISSVIGQVIGINEQISVWSLIALLPIFVWELSLGLWLVFKGFKASAPLMIAAANRTGTLDGPATARLSRTEVTAKASAA
jgi:hypothetical protein